MTAHATYPQNYLVQDEDISGSEVVYLSTTVSTTVVDSPQPDNSNTTLLHSISEIMWLSTNTTQPSITLNETNMVYQVLLNTVS